jgi:hypothetical protein
MNIHQRDNSYLIGRNKKANQCADFIYTLSILAITCAGRGMRSRSGWGTALQIGRPRVRFPMVLLECFIDIILPVTLWSWGRLSLKQKWVPGIFPGVKASGAQGWQTYQLYLPIVLKSGSLNLLEPSGPVKACNGIALPFTFAGKLLNTRQFSSSLSHYLK